MMPARILDLKSRADEPIPTAQSPLHEWLAWLEAGRGEQINLGLERAREVAISMALSRPAPIVVTVAGTNGKGSSVALLERIWRTTGYKVGAYTSPHLVRYNERVRVDGVEVSDAELCAAFAAVERARGAVPLTYFEFGTLAALRLFAQADLDVAILEVGLGGRLDAVNIIDADVALIAAIGLDHEDWLGSTREKIAIEKAGVMRRDRPVVCSDEDLPVTMVECANQIGARARILGVDYGFEANEHDWTWWSDDMVLSELPLPALSGRHQLRNAAGVLEVVRLLGQQLPVAEATIHVALAAVQLRGRFHLLRANYEYVMDVAHNPQAAAVFAATLAGMPPVARTHAVIGMLTTKKHVEFLRALLGSVDEWYFASLPGMNGARAEELAHSLKQIAPRARPQCHVNVAAAHAAAVAAANPGDRILVLGSFLTVGAMLDLIVRDPEAFR
jgi:dihydrofolate synthase / folylpolyglutamate synthase